MRVRFKTDGLRAARRRYIYNALLAVQRGWDGNDYSPRPILPPLAEMTDFGLNLAADLYGIPARIGLPDGTKMVPPPYPMSPRLADALALQVAMLPPW